jgi:hypothetical protein
MSIVPASTGDDQPELMRQEDAFAAGYRTPPAAFCFIALSPAVQLP